MRSSTMTFGPSSESVLLQTRFGKKSNKAPAQNRHNYRGGVVIPKKNSEEWK